MIEQLTQGTPEWSQFRLSKFGASEAAAMLGLSTKVKRNELLHAKATFSEKEFSEWFQKNILDYGHEVEALARPIVERIIGEDLYPVTCSAGILSASCDGLTMSEDIAFEHKQWNESLANSVKNGELPEEYMPQCQQIMLVTGASKVIFVVSNGTEDQLVHMDVFPDQAWFDRIKSGWDQFAIDVANYQYVEVLPPAVAEPTLGLPALSIQVNGSIALKSNLDIFGERLKSFIDGINKNPSDDQAFADAEAAIKVLEKAQEALETAEASALAQTASIDDMRTTVKMYCDMARTNRLVLEKVVKVRKETIRVEIMQEARKKCDEHIASLNQRLGKNYMPIINADFAGVMKGKKTILSLRDAVDTELAAFKIEANAIADKIQFNLVTLKEIGAGYEFLFVDEMSIAQKANDDFSALVRLRIAEHKAAQEKRLNEERARIAEEERIKAEAKVRAEQEAEMRSQRETQAVLEKPKDVVKPKQTTMPAPSTTQATPTRPSAQEIIKVLADHYATTEAEVISWLMSMDLHEATTEQLEKDLPG